MELGKVVGKVIKVNFLLCLNLFAKKMNKNVGKIFKSVEKVIITFLPIQYLFINSEIIVMMLRCDATKLR